MPVQLLSHFLFARPGVPLHVAPPYRLRGSLFDSHLDHSNPGGKVFSLTFQGVVGGCKGA